jgi:hypothetical protein
MNHYANSAKNYFTASPIDRLAAKRKDAVWLEHHLTSSQTRFLPVWKTKNLLAT